MRRAGRPITFRTVASGFTAGMVGLLVGTKIQYQLGGSPKDVAERELQEEFAKQDKLNEEFQVWLKKQQETKDSE